MELAKRLAALLDVWHEVKFSFLSSYDHLPKGLTALTTSSPAGRLLRRRKAKQGPTVQLSAGVYGQLLGTKARVAAYGPEDGRKWLITPGRIRADLRRAARGIQGRTHPRGRAQLNDLGGSWSWGNSDTFPYQW